MLYVISRYGPFIDISIQMISGSEFIAIARVEGILIGTRLSCSANPRTWGGGS